MRPGLRIGIALLVAVAAALAVYPYQPFTGSLPLVIAGALAVAVGVLLVQAAWRRV
jgi:hypothetical protein